MTNNKSVIDWVQKNAALLQPDNIVWIDGSEEQAISLRDQALSTGELIELNQELLPGCYLHRSDLNDVARVEHRTFICCENEIDAGPTNNWMEPSDCLKTLNRLYDGAMKGRTLYVIPFLMGPYNSKFSKIGVEITDSIYVVLSMRIMARIGNQVWEELGDSDDWVRCLHAKAELDPENRYICHFPQDNAIYSINSGYGGNALMGKKCFALRIASNLARHEGWLAEHMLILGVEAPNKEVRYVAAAFPSACGKTNLAMLIPPEVYQKRGYKIWCLGDDIAWMHKGEDGRLYAINAENGFFGVAPGTSEKSNPNALKATAKNTIFTNVAVNTDNNTVWWEKMDSNPPVNALDWQGNAWTAGSGKPAAHPNSRFTAPIVNCPVASPDLNNPNGVPISAFIFGGRRAKVAPLVYQSFNWDHGVFVGSIMASETTAANIGQVGVVRRDPMAMLPFCGYNMGDYFGHWLEMGKSLGDKAPKIFNVNWFRVDEKGNFIWPGYGENLRVIDWIIDRAFGEGEAVETEIGYMPTETAIDLEGCPISKEEFSSLLTLDKDSWLEDINNIKDFYNKFGKRLPKTLKSELEALEKRFTSGSKSANKLASSDNKDTMRQKA